MTRAKSNHECASCGAPFEFYRNDCSYCRSAYREPAPAPSRYAAHERYDFGWTDMREVFGRLDDAGYNAPGPEALAR